MIIKYMINNREEFAPFICDETFEEYCDKMMKDGEWGGTLQ